ncbi:hypothetical protein DL98DRAFT_304762 [Cadophora sp. DSE1049]|nr:hypothetical protein DL98DRAFT_304762 [Cadophora sp. DSE1049]
MSSAVRWWTKKKGFPSIAIHPVGQSHYGHGSISEPDLVWSIRYTYSTGSNTPPKTPLPMVPWR